MFSQASVILAPGVGLADTPPPPGRPPPGRHYLPWADTPSPGWTPLPQQMASAADGTHPTGMHSYYCTATSSELRTHVLV